MFIPTIPRNILSCSLISTTWKPCSRQLDLNRCLPITKPYPEAEEGFSSFSFTLPPSTPFPDSEDGLTMSGWEVWSGIMSIWSLFTLDMLKSDTSPISLVLSLPYSTMSTQDMKPNNYALCGQMCVRKNNRLTWDIPKNNWNMWESIKNLTMSRRELLSTSWPMKSWTWSLVSTTELSLCWNQFKTLRTKISKAT